MTVARLLQQPARARRRAAHPRGGGQQHAAGATAQRRRVGEPRRALPRPQDVLRGRRAHLARADRQGGRGAPAARRSTSREQRPRRLRDRDEHDLGRPRHPAARPDGACSASRRRPPSTSRRPAASAATTRRPGSSSRCSTSTSRATARTTSASATTTRPSTARSRSAASRRSPRARSTAGSPARSSRWRVTLEPELDAAARRREDRRRARRARAAAARASSASASTQQPISTRRSATSDCASVQNRVVDLLDSWRKVCDDYAPTASEMQYQQLRARRAQAAAARDARHRLRVRAPPQVPRRTARCATSSRRSTSSSRPDRRGGRGRLMSSAAHGQVRRSQVITTWGPGALIDLPRHSGIVGGLETWPKVARPRGDRRPAARSASSR